MTRNFHVSMSVRGALKNKSFEGFTDANGNEVTKNQAQDFLMDQLSMGREKVPFGEPCEGYDYIKGCPGHEIKENHSTGESVVE